MDELRTIMETFAASGWAAIALPAQQWLSGAYDKDAVIAAIEEADRVCGDCGCALDPLYRQALALLKSE